MYTYAFFVRWDFGKALRYFKKGSVIDDICIGGFVSDGLLS